MTKTELIALLESLPCAPKHDFESCPAKRLELEAQNQELRESRKQIEAALDRYSDLYDFAPVGYVTLDQKGMIQEINLTGAAMLGSERRQLLGKALKKWLGMESHNTFHQHLKKAGQANDSIVDEVMLQCVIGSPRYISMVSRTCHDGKQVQPLVRTALVDISSLKQKEEELTDSRQQLRNLSEHMDKVREDERRHLAREIHDELGQKLTTLRFEVALLNRGMDAPQPSLAQTTALLLKHIDETIDAVRTIASDLRPAVLDLGLIEAIEWQTQEFRRRTGIHCLLNKGSQEISLPDERATAVFRIVQESLTNIVRHAQASQVTITVNSDQDRLRLEISDNGIGITPNPAQKSRTVGIAGMRERVFLLGGEIVINSPPSEGTHLNIAIPLKDRRNSHNDRQIDSEADSNRTT